MGLFGASALGWGQHPVGQNAGCVLTNAAPAKPDPFRRESAYDLLFEWTNPLIAICFGMTEAAVPFIRALMIGDRAEVVIRLFGTATIPCTDRAICRDPCPGRRGFATK